MLQFMSAVLSLPLLTPSSSSSSLSSSIKGREIHGAGGRIQAARQAVRRSDLVRGNGAQPERAGTEAAGGGVLAVRGERSRES